MLQKYVYYKIERMSNNKLIKFIIFLVEPVMFFKDGHTPSGKDVKRRLYHGNGRHLLTQGLSKLL